MHFLAGRDYITPESKSNDSVSLSTHPNKPTQAVYDAWYGSSKAPVCFEVQPINRVPANIAEGSYDMPSLATNPQPASINSDGIVAKQANGSPYPKFQLVPYEGCGGNCVWQSGTGGQGSTEDCFNSALCVCGRGEYLC